MTYRVPERIKEKVKMNYVAKKCRDLKDKIFKSDNKEGKVYLVGLDHLYDPISEYIDQNTLESWKIDNLLLENSLKHKRNQEWEEEVHNIIAKGNEKVMKAVKGIIRKTNSKDLSEFMEKLVDLIYDSRIEIKLEEGLEEHSCRGIYPSEYRSKVKLDRRTKKDIKQIKKYIKKGNVAIIRGCGHLPFLEDALKKRKIKYESYILGGVPAFKTGTPSMSLLLEGYNLYVNGIREPRIKEYLEESFLIRVDDPNKDIYKQVRDKENRINFVDNKLVDLYPKFEKHPTASLFISSYVCERIPKKDFKNKVEEYLTSREFKDFISEDNLVLMGDLRKDYFKEYLD